MKNNLAGSKFMFFLIVWTLVSQIVIVGALEVMRYTNDLNVEAVMASPWFLIVYQLIIFMIPLTLWLLLRKERFKPNMPNWKLGGKNILLITALSFLLQPAMMMLSAISSMFFPNTVSEMIYGFTHYPILLTIVAIAVTPAICEEVVFRGYIQSRQRGSIKKIALLNGLFFAIIHFNLQQFAYAFAMGIIFAYFVYYSRSIWAGILPHFIINAAQATLGRWAFSIEQVEPVPEPQMSEVLMGLGIVVLVLLPVVIILFRLFVRHNRWRITAQEQSGKDSVISRYDDYENSTPTEDTSWLAAGYDSFDNTDAAPVEVSHDVPPDMPAYTQDTGPSRFDFYAVGVVVIFIAIIALTLLIQEPVAS